MQRWPRRSPPAAARLAQPTASCPRCPVSHAQYIPGPALSMQGLATKPNPPPPFTGGLLRQEAQAELPTTTHPQGAAQGATSAAGRPKGAFTSVLHLTPEMGTGHPGPHPTVPPRAQIGGFSPNGAGPSRTSPGPPCLRGLGSYTQLHLGSQERVHPSPQGSGTAWMIPSLGQGVGKARAGPPGGCSHQQLPCPWQPAVPPHVAKAAATHTSSTLFPPTPLEAGAPCLPQPSWKGGVPPWLLHRRRAPYTSLIHSQERRGILGTGALFYQAEKGPPGS